MASCAAQNGGKRAAMNTTNNMREIKFRIWDRQAKAWAENDCSLHCFSNWQIDPFTGQLTDFVGAIDGDRETRYNANPAPNYYFRGSEIVNEPRYVLVQFTGMKDKNGVEIYEGDFICFNKTEGLYSDQKYPMVAATHPYVQNRSHLGKVIGNSFENPELLEA